MTEHITSHAIALSFPTTPNFSVVLPFILMEDLIPEPLLLVNLNNDLKTIFELGVENIIENILNLGN